MFDQLYLGATAGRKQINPIRNCQLDAVEDPCTWKLGVNRTMHEGNLNMITNSPETNYTTVTAEAFSGRGRRGETLVFFPRDAEFPSQHSSSLDLSNSPIAYMATHSRDVHSPKDITPHTVLRSYGLRNLTHNHQGSAMKEVTNPPGSTVYHSSSHDSHQGAYRSDSLSITTMGHPTTWHSHNILTGEEVRPAGPGKPQRAGRIEALCPQPRWEKDCTAFRLY
ncbi:uncharacterized protein LOC134467682 [Engraulis encrasicolus]|uniref:uncharacterized protein LOC134467682 n=1 Tax=Engraulis encrasicolus TaxID=184585 RepID=UPI002FD11AD6